MDPSSVIVDGIAYSTSRYASARQFVDNLAADRSSLPDWLSFDPPVVELVDGKTYVCVDYLNAVRNSNETNLNFASFPTSLRRDAERIFIATNLELERTNSDSVEQLLNEMHPSFTTLTYSEMLETWRQKDDIATRLAYDVSSFQTRVASMYADDRLTEESIKKSDPEFKNVVLSLELRTEKNYDVKDLFNSISLNDRVPFCYCAGLYKLAASVSLQKGIVDEWIELSADEKMLVLKVDNTLTTTGGNFASVALAVVENERRIAMTVNSNVGKKYVTVPTLIARIKSVFTYDEITRGEFTINELSTTGYVAYPDRSIDPVVMADFIMNDSRISSTCAIDEFYRASKKKSDIYVHVLNSATTISLVEATTTKYNMYGGLFKYIGEKYVKARIKAKSARDLLDASDFVASLLRSYDDAKLSIIDAYRKFIPSFATDSSLSTLKRKKKITVRDLEPEVFYPNYSRKCLYRPTIVESASGYPDDKVMTFPKFGESRVRAYICENPSHPYPGLQANVLENKYKFPYVPCCYAKPQKGNAGSLYYKYFNAASRPSYDELIKQRRKRVDVTPHSETSATKKILQRGVAGKLPTNVNNLLTALCRDPSKYWFRLGAGPNLSAVESCAKAVGQLPLDVTSLRAQEYLTDFVEKIKLEREKYALAASQEMYRRDPIDVLVNFDVNSKLITASSFVHLLETYFECDAFIFTSSGLVVPDHRGGAYYKYAPEFKTVFLYEHFVDDVKYCELIGYETSDGTRVTSFDYDDELVVGLFDNVFCQLNNSFNRDTGHVLRRTYRPSYYDDVVAQRVNSDGKCRLVNVRFEDRIVTALVPSCAPYAAKRLTTMYPSDAETVARFAAEHELVPAYQTISRDFDDTSELRCEDGTVIFYQTSVGKVIGVAEINDDDVSSSLLPKNFADTVKSFTRNKKLANLLAAVSFKSLLTDGVKDVYGADDKFTVNSDKDWFSELATIRSNDFNSDAIAKLFIDPSDGKIIVPSDNCVSRLLFMYDHLVKYGSKNELDSYSTKSYAVPNSYVDSADYDRVVDQIILPNYDSAKLYAKYVNLQPDRVKTEPLAPSETSPYFIALIGYDKVYVAQNVPTLDDAKKTALFFDAYEYNGFATTEYDEFVVDVNRYNLSSYEYKNNRFKLLVDGDVNSSATLTYAFDDQTRYAAILKLSDVVV